MYVRVAEESVLVLAERELAELVSVGPVSAAGEWEERKWLLVARASVLVSVAPELAARVWVELELAELELAELELVELELAAQVLAEPELVGLESAAPVSGAVALAAQVLVDLDRWCGFLTLCALRCNLQLPWPDRNGL
jgi:hypothetical protein